MPGAPPARRAWGHRPSVATTGAVVLEVRPETRPRHLVSRLSECARAAEHRSTRISNAHARSTEGPGKGAPTQWGCNGPHGRQRSGRAFRPHLYTTARW